MTARRSGKNPVTGAVARLMVAAGTGVLDAVLELAADVRVRRTTYEPLPLLRRVDWWNTPEPSVHNPAAPARSSRRSRRTFPTDHRS